MTASKYHISTNGTYAPCVATVRNCTRGGHVSAEEYAKQRENGDPRFATAPAETTPLTKDAEDQFRAAQKAYDEAVKFEAERKEAVREWEKENPRPGGRIILGSTLDRVGKNAKYEIERILSRHGVNPAKARFIVQDTPTSGPDAYLPPVKKTDKFDADIKQKTEAARAEAEQNKKVVDARDVLDWYGKQQAWERKRTDYSLSQRRGNLSQTTGTADATLNAAQTVLAVKRSWQKAGVPGEAKEANSLKDVTPANVQVDDKGEITNLWYANAVNGKVERITSYVHPENNGYGSASGYFLTDEGTKISHQVRYANYRKNVTDPATGSTRILVAPVEKGAKTYPTAGLEVGGDSTRAAFATYGEVDSGG